MKRFIPLAMLAAAMLAPRATHAQDAPERRTSLSLNPFGTTTIGVWHWLSPRMELGLQIGGSVSGEEGEDDRPDESRSSFLVEPGAKLFGAPRGDLRPYTAGSVYFNGHRSELGDDIVISSTGLGASLGLGLEWTPAERIRIGGHAGVRAAMVNGERTTYEIDGPVQYDVRGWDVSTFTTGLTFYYSF